MSIRSKKIPGTRLGLGTFVNSDIDAKRKVVYFGVMTWTAANLNRTFTQGQTLMDTIECVLLGRESSAGASGSGSLFFTAGTVDGGTMIVHSRDQTTGAGNTNKNECKMSYWFVGSPDPQRIIV